MSKLVDLDERTVIRPKLIRFGDNVYRRLDLEVDGFVDDYSLKRDPRQQNFFLPKKFVDKDIISKKQYNIDELEAEDFQDEEETQSLLLPPISKATSKKALPCDDVRLDDNFNADLDDNLVLKEGEELKSTSNNNRSGFSLKLRVCPVFYPFIIGKRGSTKANLESDTRTRITVPRENDKLRNVNSSGGSFITITGADKRSLVKVKRRIDSLIESFRNRLNMTHFVAVPIGSTNETIRSRFEAFKAAILGDVQCSLTKGITESAFQSGARLHLTLRALYLGDSFERVEAKKILERLKTEVIDGLLKDKPKIVLRMKGIDYMNDDPSEVRVLYAKVEATEKSSDLFKKIVNKTFDYFTPLGKDSYGLENSEWKVKIHATLLNIRYTEEQQDEEETNQISKEGGESDSKKKKRGGPQKHLTMDVRNIVEKFADYNFGTFTLDQLHICTTGSTFEKDEYYATLAEIHF